MNDPTRRKRSTAARLLDLIAERDEASLADVARAARTPVSRLTECQAGIRPLDLDQQLRLAAVAESIAPELVRPARALFAQAQAALRMHASEGQRHLTYPIEPFR
jgi:hypothetical protein